MNLVSHELLLSCLYVTEQSLAWRGIVFIFLFLQQEHCRAGCQYRGVFSCSVTEAEPAHEIRILNEYILSKINVVYDLCWPRSAPAIFELLSAILMPYLSGAEWHDEIITVLLGSSSDWSRFRRRTRRCRLGVSLLILRVLLLLQPFSATASAVRPAVKETQGETISQTHFRLIIFIHFPWALGEK